MLKRSGFTRKQPDHKRPERKPLVVTPPARWLAGKDQVPALFKPVPKPLKPVRSEAYRRLVAQLPCIACMCGPCQAAHPNTGKGMAMKTDDRLCFPLCIRCHAAFDQGAMFSKAARRQIEPAWGADTRRRIIAMGQWPQRLPRWEE